MVMRLKWAFPALLLAICGLAASQTTPASTAPAELQTESAATHSPTADSSQAAAPAVPPSSLSPQQQRLLDQTDQLVTLAQQLKSEVDKTNQYTLSLNTLRRAEDIEKLAKNLQKQIHKENR